jgi:hypothetical protein
VPGQPWYAKNGIAENRVKSRRKNLNLKKMKKYFLLLLSAIFMLGAGLHAQAPFEFKQDDAALEAMSRYSASSSKAKVIEEALAAKGFIRDGTATAITGTYNGEACQLFIVDYVNENGQTASQILQIKGGKEYSAMDIFKEPNNEAANFGYEEYYVNDAGGLVLTHSFFSCFFNTISQKCGPIINVNQIWNKCKKYLPFKLSKFFNCVVSTAIGQISNFLNCLWANLWSTIWKCL